jgi:hypothetical protein
MAPRKGQSDIIESGGTARSSPKVGEPALEAYGHEGIRGALSRASKPSPARQSIGVAAVRSKKKDPFGS